MVTVYEYDAGGRCAGGNGWIANVYKEGDFIVLRDDEGDGRKLLVMTMWTE